MGRAQEGGNAQGRWVLPKNRALSCSSLHSFGRTVLLVLEQVAELAVQVPGHVVPGIDDELVADRPLVDLPHAGWHGPTWICGARKADRHCQEEQERAGGSRARHGGRSGEQTGASLEPACCGGSRPD